MAAPPPYLQASEAGLALIVMGSDVEWVRVATATWDAPTTLRWLAVNARDLRKLRDTESYPSPNALTSEGLWLGEDWSFSRLDLATGRITFVAPLRPRGTLAGRMVAVDGGVITSLFHSGSSDNGGLAFFDARVRAQVVLPQRPDIWVAKLAVSRAPVDELLWIEERSGSQCELFRAPTVRRAADFRPRSVARLPRGCSLLTGPALAHAGRFVHVAGEPSVTDPGELQIVEVDTGLGWRVLPAHGRDWGSPVGLTQQALWVTSNDISVRVDGEWKFGAHPGVVRLDLAELGPAASLK